MKKYAFRKSSRGDCCGDGERVRFLMDSSWNSVRAYPKPWRSKKTRRNHASIMKPRRVGWTSLMRATTSPPVACRSLRRESSMCFSAILCPPPEKPNFHPHRSLTYHPPPGRMNRMNFCYALAIEQFAIQCLKPRTMKIA